MAVNSLIAAANGLLIGNGSAHGFMGLIGGVRLTGGIKQYTLDRGYYFNNISNNFGGGLVGRYGYGSEENNDIKHIIEGTDGVYLSGDELVPASLEQDKIGDFYSTRYVPQNAYYSFYSLDDFTKIGRALRNEQLHYNVSGETFNKRYKEYDIEQKTTPKKIAKFLAGDDAGVGMWDKTPKELSNIFRGRQELKEANKAWRILAETNRIIAGTEDEKYRSYDGSADVYRGDDITTVRKNRWWFKSEIKKDAVLGFDTKNILEIAKAVRDEYREIRKTEPYNNFEIRYYGKRGDTSQAVKNEYGDIVSLRNAIGNLQTSTIKLKDGNILDYYKEERNTYKSLYHNTSYGVLYTDSEFPVYKIGKDYKAKEAKIDRKFTAGALRSNGKGNFAPTAATYSYYEEVDGNAPVTAGSSHGADTMQGFVPQISNFDNASNILKKTNEYFSRGKIKSLVNRFHSDKVNDDDFLLTAYDAEKGLSRGRNLKRASAADKNTGFDNPYCRVWTAHHQYSTMKDRIRPFSDESGRFVSIADLQKDYGGLRVDNGAQRLSDNSVLQTNGFVKISPYNRGGERIPDKKELKKYMFSIENLAWKDSNMTHLSSEQIGPFGGRIMWFPPYNLKFSENINTSWKDNDFIGRGEKIYTYVNTDRGGTLDFTLLIDHPSIINKWASKQDANEKAEQTLLRFFAGCGPLDETDSDTKKEDNNGQNTPPINIPLDDAQYIKVSYIIFFSNNFSAKKYLKDIPKAVTELDKYENANSDNAFQEMDIAYANQKLAPDNYNNLSKYQLNLGGWSDSLKNKIYKTLNIAKDEELYSYADLKNLNSKFVSNGNVNTVFGRDTRQFEIEDIELRGFASSHGYPELNKVLEKDRATMIGALAKHFSSHVDEKKFRIVETREVEVIEEGKTKDVNNIYAKIGRSAMITFRIKLKESAQEVLQESGNTRFSNAESAETVDDEVAEVPNEASVTTVDDSDYSYGNEYLYFKEITESNSLVYKNIVEKIKFFNPSYHSLTPEGFNARLNFLHQCTRQGPTRGSHNGGDANDQSNMSKMAGNLAFGRAPYCILRIGDFFYSKICIDSISINYDNGGGTQWDLNPEGVGVQPMMANVNMSFRFIGGQDIEGPVAQLQNAISFNYYANSSIYSHTTQKAIPEHK